MSNLIDEKLISQSKSLIEDKATIQTYASVARSMNSAITKYLRAIMLETKHEEIAEELDQKSRVNNLIIHGKQEVNLFKDLQVETITIKQIERTKQRSATKANQIGVKK